MSQLIRASCIALAIWLTTLSHAWSFSSLDNTLQAVEKDLGAKIGIAIYDTKTKEHWSYRGNERFPLLSTFKTLACAKLLFDADKGHVKKTKTVTVDSTSLVSYSPVLETKVNQTVSIEESCSAAMLYSDNSAANIVLNTIGGPESLNQFLRTIGDDVTNLQRMELDLNEAQVNDPRDTTTPEAMNLTLNQLLFSSVLTDGSTEQLFQWLKDNKATGQLFRAELPEGWQIADRSGAGGFGSRGINAVI